ncbi:Peptidoglycan-binding (PGRP) domain of peptidoglycan hydrolases-containing protein [Paenibacillus sp. OK060]|uniref:glycoside hydrolase domain-containing protein n=1 Tax=Paenibacillus sp. OK060 TaxID=1881034 RepID=UPI000888DE11|nr:glycoside hydrolase domain-containing protein [Paenibacillus sp. OK060]SDM29622.1 Peptidoglycan-binding (PGRP) domain of peptidoglycan hydrolases-containing protein [Paenibacillus sp. OK060]
MDARVLQTQVWLNNTYGDRLGFTRVTADGLTGWSTIYSLIRALQLELGIPGAETSDTFGPKTESLFQPISKQSTGAPTNNLNFILQGALFCKGYNPGGFTGNFFDGTEKTVKELQSDVGLAVQDGIVNAALMKALLNMSSYKLSLIRGGSASIRRAQQNLNRDYNRYFGLMPTDGIYSRETNKALIYALQAEEGLAVGVANGNFGPSTISLCPTLSESNSPRGFVRILQYALVCNGSEYDTGDFDGVYDSSVTNAVKRFQTFMMLPVTGVANMSTIKQLMTSNGDTNRSATACDASTILTAAHVNTLVSNGYKVVGRYLTGNVSTGNGGVRSKAMTAQELQIIFNRGLRVFPIYQDGGHRATHFVTGQGKTDAHKAHLAARSLGFGSGTTIYFAVDYDAYDYEVTEKLIPYFREIREVFETLADLGGMPAYKVGIYGARNTCIRTANDLKAKTDYSFVSDMSTGFSGNLGFPMPDNWAFDQFFETSIGSGDGKLAIDKNAYSGRDTGVSSVTPPADLKREALFTAWLDMISSFPILKDTPSLYSTNFVFNTTQRVFSSTMVDIDVTTQTEYEFTGNNMHKINITNGKLGVSAENILGSTETKLSVEEVKDFKNFLNNVSLSVENGILAISTTPQGNKLVMEIKVFKNEIPLFDGTKATLEVTVVYTFKHVSTDQNPNYDTLAYIVGGAAIVAAIIAAAIMAPAIGVGGIAYGTATAIIAFLAGIFSNGDDGNA